MTAAKVMPVDLAMYTGLSQRTPVGQLLGMTSLKSHRRTSSYDPQAAKVVALLQHRTSPTSQLDSTGKSETLKRKKRVTFADAIGLALTDVRLFSVDAPTSVPETVPSPGMEKDQPTEHSRTLRLWLGFPQPAADIPSFLKGLGEGFVKLESCSLAGGLLSGTVRVCNISLEKVVHVRITFDSWKSHRDVLCTYIPKKYADFETEQFAFSMPIPSDFNLEERVEFCVSFRPGSSKALLWDKNGGQNYRIFAEVVDHDEVPLVRKRPMMTQSLLRLQPWPTRKGQTVYNPACFSPLNSPENVFAKTLSRRENLVPLC